jgi:hypothetical protein
MSEPARKQHPAMMLDQSTNLGIVNVYRDSNGVAYVVTTGATDASGNADRLFLILQSWQFTD